MPRSTGVRGGSCCSPQRRRRPRCVRASTFAEPRDVAHAARRVDGRRRRLGRRPRAARRHRRSRRLGHPRRTSTSPTSAASAPRSSSSAGSPPTSPTTASTCRVIRRATCSSSRSSTASGSRNAPLVASLEIVGGALAVPAVLIAVREVAGEAHGPRARGRSSPPRRSRSGWRPAPMRSTRASAAWAVTLVVVATGRDDRRGDRRAVAGGVLFGATAFLSYGLVLLAVIPLVASRSVGDARARSVLAAVGASVVFAALRARRASGGSPAWRRPAPATTPAWRPAGRTTCSSS